VDELPAVAIVADRFKLRETLADINAVTAGKIQLPSGEHVLDKVSLLKMAERSVLQPYHSVQGAGAAAWLVKPRVACGPDQAHQMALVFHPSALSTQVRQHALLLPIVSVGHRECWPFHWLSRIAVCICLRLPKYHVAACTTGQDKKVCFWFHLHFSFLPTK
jgi:hypothetical protein